MRNKKDYTYRPARLLTRLPTRQARQAGFTLMELIIVIAVIAILIGIAIPGFFGMLTEAHITQAQGDLRTLKTAIESYFMHQTPPSYPTPGVTWEAQLTNATPRILGEILHDPFGATDTSEYTYVSSDNGLYYVISSLGPDGEGDVTGVGSEGRLMGIHDDDIFVTNGTGFVE